MTAEIDYRRVETNYTLDARRAVDAAAPALAGRAVHRLPRHRHRRADDRQRDAARAPPPGAVRRGARSRRSSPRARRGRARSTTLHQAVVAGDFARERDVVLERLRRAGAHCIDAAPDGLLDGAGQPLPRHQAPGAVLMAGARRMQLRSVEFRREREATWRELEDADRRRRQARPAHAVAPSSWRACRTSTARRCRRCRSRASSRSTARWSTTSRTWSGARTSSSTARASTCAASSPTSSAGSCRSAVRRARWHILVAVADHGRRRDRRVPADVGTTSTTTTRSSATWRRAARRRRRPPSCAAGCTTETERRRHARHVRGEPVLAQRADRHPRVRDRLRRRAADAAAAVLQRPRARRVRRAATRRAASAGTCGAGCCRTA